MKTTTIVGGSFVPADVAAPPASIASILGIQLQRKSTHLFDVTGLATMSTVRNHETKYGPRAIVDITVIDSSKTPNGKAAEIDFTIYFNVKKVGDESTEHTMMLQAILARKPLSFFALSVTLNDDNKREIKTSGEFFWEVALAQGQKTVELVSKPELQSLDAASKEKYGGSCMGSKRCT